VKEVEETVDSGRSKVSVIIPTYNRKDVLSGVIAPLLDDPSTGEILIIIDGSSDGTLEYLERWSESESRIIPSWQSNAGPAKARQRGIELANNDIVLLLDDDVTPGPLLVTKHLQHHREKSRLVVVGYLPTAVPEHRVRGQVPTILYAQDYERICALYDRDSSGVLVNLWSGNMSMRREVALEIGFASGADFPYHEDMYFGIQCIEAGVEGIFDRSLFSSHHHTRNIDLFLDECRRSGTGRALLLREFPKYAAAIKPLMALDPLVAQVVRTLSLPLVRSVAIFSLRKSYKLAGRLRLWRLEKLSAQVLRQIELYHAFLQASNR